MIVCPVCDFRNMDANDKCFRCGALLKRKQETIDEAFAKADAKTRRHLRAQIWRAPLERLQAHPWVKRIQARPEYDPSVYRYPFTAGLLSIILPGLGHVYAGQKLKGLLLMPIGAAFFVIAVLTLRESWSNYFLLLMAIFWLYAWGSSVAVALTANGASTVLRHVIALFFAAMLLFGAAVAITQFLGLGVFSIQKITSGAMAPYLVQGERVVFSGVPLWFRHPRRDELIMFDPPRFVAESNDVVSINIRRYYQKVIGVGGDHIRKEGDQMWRNGQLLTQDQLPFGVDTMGDFELTVPQDSYYAPVTLIPEADWMAKLHGAPSIPYYGAGGYIYTGWEGHPFITDDIIWEKGIAIIHPPQRRRFLP